MVPADGPTPSNTPYRLQFCPRVTLGLRHDRRLRTLSTSQRRWGTAGESKVADIRSVRRVQANLFVHLLQGRFSGIKRKHSLPHATSQQTNPRDESASPSDLSALLSPHSGSILVRAIRAKGGR